jgi:hypothetical protein
MKILVKWLRYLWRTTGLPDCQRALQADCPPKWWHCADRICFPSNPVTYATSRKYDFACSGLQKVTYSAFRKYSCTLTYSTFCCVTVSIENVLHGLFLSPIHTHYPWFWQTELKTNRQLVNAQTMFSHPLSQTAEKKNTYFHQHKYLYPPIRLSPPCTFRQTIHLCC